MKIFGIGMFKTGTTSFGAALGLLGLKAFPNSWGILNWDGWDPRQKPPLFRRRWKKILRFANKYDGLCDAPWLFLYKQLDQHFPNSKFVLTTRDYEKVASSDLAMWRRENVPPHKIPPKEQFVNRIRIHEEMVLEYFKDRPHDLLVMNICDHGDGWEKLCPFLGQPIPKDIQFPHANKGLY